MPRSSHIIKIRHCEFYGQRRERGREREREKKEKTQKKERERENGSERKGEDR